MTAVVKYINPTKQVIEIRQNRLEGATLNQLALAYGVCFQNISDIVNRKSWRHV